MVSDQTEKLYRILYPMRIVIISCAYEDKSNWMPATWCFPLSAEPAIFGVCVAKKRYTYELIHKSKRFAINIPGEDLKETIIKLGRVSGSGCNKFALAHLTAERGKLGLPLIKECLTTIECSVVDEKEIGDHVLFVGKAENVIKRREGKGLYHMGGDDIRTL
jgi:flavin reductase (DIM6/NTAB) family NADH-FMN oxidoreductase RutF